MYFFFHVQCASTDDSRGSCGSFASFRQECHEVSPTQDQSLVQSLGGDVKDVKNASLWETMAIFSGIEWDIHGL